VVRDLALAVSPQQVGAPMPHRARAPHDPRCPAHVTLRVRAGLPSLRRRDVLSAVCGAFARASTESFRLLQFSVQSNHVHLLVEADAPRGLSRGIQGLSIRIAKAVNRVLGRHGVVWSERYHARALKTPREMRNALVYVLNNLRKHLRNARGMDPGSSARWFRGWREAAAPVSEPPIATPRTWLARVGWLRHGLIRIDESPRESHRIRRRKHDNCHRHDH
jgi:REP element-mobilizing transposase RayT